MSHPAYVTTVIAPRGTEKLQLADLHSFCEILGSDDIIWLKESVACDILHGHMPPSLLTLPECDVVTQPLAYRRKKLLVSDMDSTLIEQECIDELAGFLGIKDQVALITERAMNGELNFKAALRERVMLLKGLPQSALQEVYNTKITLMPGAKTLVATMKAHGAYCLLVSGGFTFFTSRIREVLGFDEDHSNELDFADGVLTGNVKEPILDKESKLASLLESCSKLHIEPSQSLAVGDGANDLPMIQAAGLGVAYHAKPVVQEQARACVNHNDLSALLYIQGYKAEEWASV